MSEANNEEVKPTPPEATAPLTPEQIDENRKKFVAALSQNVVVSKQVIIEMIQAKRMSLKNGGRFEVIADLFFEELKKLEGLF